MTDDLTPLFSLLNMTGGYAVSRVLMVAGKFGLFSPPFDPITPGGLAARRHLSEKGSRLLLDALTSLNFFEKIGNTYRVRGDLRRCLEQFPELYWDLIHQDHLYDVWKRLEKGIQAGRAPSPPKEVLKHYPTSLEIFLRAMRVHAILLAPEIIAALPWRGIHHLLDIGGGGAGFAHFLTRRYNDLRVMLYDLPDAVTLTKKIISDQPGADRITLRAGNAYSDPLPAGPFDRILISHLLHIYSPEDNCRLLVKAASHLKPGGDLLLVDYFLDASETAPREAVLFRLLMMIGTPEGDGYSISSAHRWLEGAGLIPTPPVRLSRGNTLLAGRKPGGPSA